MTTLVELFDRSPIENIIGSLALKPDVTVFVGTDVRRMQRALPAYEAILRGRGIKTELLVRSAARSDLESTVAVLDALLDDRSDEPDEVCAVDISGGDETALLAVGAILGSRAGEKRNLYAFRCGPITRQATIFRMDRTSEGHLSITKEQIDYTEKGESPLYLTVDEMVRLHGGIIVSRSQTISPGAEEEEDIEALWRISKRACADWNTLIGRMSAEVSRSVGEEGVWAIPHSSFGSGKNRLNRAFFDKLADAGLIRVTEQNGDMILFTYKNKIVRECLTKAGSILEYHTYCTALDLRRGGMSVYDSAAIGVVLDWDGNPNGTKNEVDVVLVRGVVPVFISCKNGDIDVDELYKVDTVAGKFGGTLSRRVLLSTVFLDPESKGFAGPGAANTLEERAHDMSVRTISAVHRMKDGELGDALANLVKQ